MEFTTDMFKKKKTEVDMKKYSMTFYGEAGVGKTSLVHELFEKPMFLAFENGQKALDDYISIPVNSWKDFKMLIKYFKKLKSENYAFPSNVVVIDTVDVAISECQTYVCNINEWEHPSDGEWGKGWSAVKTEYNETLKELERLGFLIVRICHETVREIKPEVGTPFNQIQPNVGSPAWGNTVDDPDFVCYLKNTTFLKEDGKFSSKRELWFRNDGIYLAKSRNTNIVNCIECGDSAKETAERFKKAFYDAIGVSEEDVQQSLKQEEQQEKQNKAKEVQPVKQQKQDNALLQQAIKEIIELGKSLIQEGKINNSDMKDLVVNVSGKSKIVDVDKIEDCQEILKAMKSL